MVSTGCLKQCLERLALVVLIYVQIAWISTVQSQQSGGSCQLPNITYISTVKVIANDTEQLRVKTSTEYCYLWNIIDYTEENVNCAKYGSSVTREWSSGDVDSTNTSVSSVTVTDDTVTIEMDRNSESLTIEMSNTLYNNTVSSDIIHGYWTVNSLYTTFIMITDANLTLPSKAVSIEFASQSDNTNPQTHDIYLKANWKDAFIEDMYEEGANAVDVYESYNLLNFRARESSCVDTILFQYNYEYSDSLGQYILNLTKVASEVFIDARTDDVVGYRYLYSDTITVYDFIENSDGSLANISTNSYELALEPPAARGASDDDIDLYWGFIIMGLVLLLIGTYSAGLYWYSERKAKQPDEDE